MSKLKKIKTVGYSSKLDELIGEDVYVKVKLVKRLTYGEYVGEPKNGFLIDFDNRYGLTEEKALDVMKVYTLNEEEK